MRAHLEKDNRFNLGMTTFPFERRYCNSESLPMNSVTNKMGLASRETPSRAIMFGCRRVLEKGIGVGGREGGRAGG